MNESREKQYQVLIVDKEDGALRLLKRILLPYYKIFTVSQVESAIKILDSEGVHLIISDTTIPGSGGVKFCSISNTAITANDQEKKNPMQQYLPIRVRDRLYCLC